MEFVQELDHLRLNLYKQVIIMLRQNINLDISQELMVQSEHKIKIQEAQILERLINTKVVKKKKKKKIHKSRPKIKTRLELDEEDDFLEY
jgi:hypothetical protein